MLIPTLVVGALIGIGVFCILSPTSYGDIKNNIETIDYNNTSDKINEKITSVGSDASNFTSTINYNYTFTPHIGNMYYVGADDHEITLIHNSKAIDPTYNQMVDFIRRDSTDEHPYIPGSFTCGDFAEMVQNNAEKAGYKCAWVSINLEDGKKHACNAFNTTDRGIVFIDCTHGDGVGNWDTYVNVADGQVYAPCNLYADAGGVIYSGLGEVKDHTIFWDSETQIN
jgi:hypothetical protein